MNLKKIFLKIAVQPFENLFQHKIEKLLKIKVQYPENK